MMLCNSDSPAVTAHNRFGNLLQTPVQPLLGPCLGSLPFYCIPGGGGGQREAHRSRCHAARSALWRRTRAMSRGA